MPSYWWECISCKKSLDFRTACGSKGVVHYIRDVLIPSDWDQSLLAVRCPDCADQSLRIAYEFPRGDRLGIRVLHIVGLGEMEDDYIPMMWETLAEPYNRDPWFDFKYLGGRNIWGLNKPAVFTRSNLKALFDLYCRKTNVSEKFP